MDDQIDLKLDLHSSMDRDGYLKHWERLYRIEIKLTDKIGDICIYAIMAENSQVAMLPRLENGGKEIGCEEVPSRSRNCPSCS